MTPHRGQSVSGAILGVSRIRNETESVNGGQAMAAYAALLSAVAGLKRSQILAAGTKGSCENAC